MLGKELFKLEELDLTADQLVQVLRPVYVLEDAGEYSSEILPNHLKEHCQFKQSVTDLCSSWLQTVRSKILALAVMYVDDVLQAVKTTVFNEFVHISKARSDMTIDSSPTINYVGLTIQILRDGTRTSSQRKQIH